MANDNPPTRPPRRRAPRTLRDDFALAALPAIIVSIGPGKQFAGAADDSYRCADAMLRARAK